MSVLADCQFRLIDTTDGAKPFRHRCEVCHFEWQSRYADPRMIRRNCGPAAAKPAAPAKVCTGACPGSELTAIFKALGATPIQGCDCARLAAEMDGWRVDGCEQHRNEILVRLAKNYKQFSLTDKMKAAILAWPAGVATRIKWTDPLPGLLDLAIARSKLAAEKSDNQCGGKSDAG
jgi:hypothetical protein